MNLSYEIINVESNKKGFGCKLFGNISSSFSESHLGKYLHVSPNIWILEVRGTIAPLLLALAEGWRGPLVPAGSLWLPLK